MTFAMAHRNLLLPAIPLAATVGYIVTGSHSPLEHIPAVLIAAGGLSALLGVLVEREVAVAGRWRVFLLGQYAAASAVVIWIGSRYFRWPLTQLPLDPPNELFADRPGAHADHVAPVETGPRGVIDNPPGALDETGQHDARDLLEALLHE